MNFKLLLLFLLSPSTAFLIAQPIHQEKLEVYSIKRLNEDFTILRTCIEKTHAGLYAYISKKELDAAFDAIKKDLQQPMTSISFFRKISPLLKLIGNGHTNFFPPLAYQEAINTELPRFPFSVYWNENKLYILRNLSNNQSIESGTIIKSINGEPAENIVKALADNLTRDAHNTASPEEKVQQDFSGKYAFYKGTPDVFQLELINENGKNHLVEIQGLTYPEIVAGAEKRNSDWIKNKRIITSKLPLEFTIKNGIGILTARSFSKPNIKKNGQDYKDFFKNTFAQIGSQNIQHLILDLRNNGGGYPEVIIDLYRYLSDVPYIHELDAYTFTKKLPHRKHYQYGFWEELDLRFSCKLKKEGDIYRVTKNAKKKTYPPAKNNFKGALYVLINPFSYSATSDLLGMLRNVHRGKFIGGISGGSTHRATSWIMPTLVLPNTKIPAIIPLVHTTSSPDFKEDLTGIHPDYFIRNTIEEMIEGKDAAMKFTLELIESKK